VPSALRDAWLAHDRVDLGPYPSAQLDAWAVSPLVNRADADGPELLRPV
jgi:hypothetical protein